MCYKKFMLFECNSFVMNDINDELQSRINEYKKRIEELESQTEKVNEMERKERDFELADLKAKLNLAESELKTKDV